MKILKFTLSGKTGFFKKPDVNTYFYFTYGNIHKVALLGIFGAILGFGGYNSMKLREKLNKSNKKDKIELPEFPEFYEKLKEMKVSIIPRAKRGSISKKMQLFNNSVGYASKEQGGNLIVKEQWLENPSWDICVLIEDEECQKLAEYIIDKKSIYIPYLGKNDHPADITNIELIDCEEITDKESVNNIDCLCKKNEISIFIKEDDEEDDCSEEEDDEQHETNGDNVKNESNDLFKYEEKLPICLSKETNMYEYETFIFTNMNVKCNNNCTIYKVYNKNIVFY